MIVLTGFIVAIVVLAITLKYVKRTERFVRRKPVPKPPGLPFIGQALEINESNTNAKFSELAKRYGEIFGLKLIGKNVVVLNSMPLMRKAYCSEQYAQYFGDIGNSFFPKYCRNGGESVGFANEARGQKYKTMKKTFLKALHTYGAGIKDLEDKVLTEMHNIRSKIDNMKPKEFEFVSFVQRSLSNIISIILVGKTIPDGDPDENLFWQSIEYGEHLVSQKADCVLSAFPILRFFPMLHYGKMFLAYMDVHRRIIDKYFHSVQAVHRAGDEQGIVQFYLEQQRKERLTKGNDIFLTDDIIHGQMHETVDAGIATTWCLLTSSMLILLNHPECQSKIQEEIDRVIGREGVPSFSDRGHCPYIQAFEKEVHRYATVLPLLIPHTCNNNVEFEGYGIEKDTMVIANAWFVHHDEKIWGDPWNFRPERFLDEHGEMLPTEHLLCRSVLAFGLGERRCIGETFAKTRYFLYIVTLLQNYQFETTDDTKEKGCDPRNPEVFGNKFLLRAKPFTVRAVPR